MPIDAEHLNTIIRAMEAAPNSKAGLWVEELRHLIPKHDWQFYMNGSFCSRCSEPMGSPRPCR